MIITGDSLQELKKLPPNSIDSVVTDPPYGLSFMGKAWDYDVPTKELWIEVLRVLKPGGYLLAFAGTRTQHRMAVNIEDAGFEIRDMIAWIYGSGFPKSHNIGKAVDKQQGNDREVTGEREVPDIRGDAYGTMNDKQGGSYNSLKIQDTKGNSPYEGWGTALKPALEPITVARKPFKGNVANNVLEWGTGGINIDGSRVGSEQITQTRTQMKTWREKEGRTDIPESADNSQTHTQGRFPANLIHDGSDEVVGLFPDTKSGKPGIKRQGNNGAAYGAESRPAGTQMSGIGDSGSAARFFYCAKASKSERNKGLEGFEAKIATQRMNASTERYEEGREPTPRAEQSKSQNTHPTVKPVRLMQYLVKLVTPVGGTCLDPFNGSGTTGIAAKLENFEYIGIELDPEYVKLSEARIDAWERENTLI